MDAAADIKAGSVVTAMTRNGREFGIRVSGTGDRWFTAPVNTPQGLFFTGYSQADANPDIGDSAITETLGIGGMPSCGWLPVGQTGLAVRMIMRDGADELTDGFLVGMKRLQGVAS
jgi:hypothetical protein